MIQAFLILFFFLLSLINVYVLENEYDSEDDLQCIKSDDSDEDELDEDEIRAIAQQEEDERRAKAQQEEDERRARATAQLEEDEQLAKAIQDSLRVDSPPRYDSGNIFQHFPFFSGYR